MLIFYVDECGDHAMALDAAAPEPTLKKGTSEWFTLPAVGVHDSTRKPLAEALFEIKARHFGEDVALLQPWSNSEIKGRYLFRAARGVATGNTLARPAAWSGLDTTAKVGALVADLGLVFMKLRPLVFVAAVDKKARLTKKKAAPPLGAAYAYLEQRVALTMENLFAGETAIVVADQQTQHETFFRSGRLNEVRDGMTKPLPLQPNFNLVLDKPLWIDTHLSSWDREIIQLADIAAYSATECLRRGSAPTEACYLWDKIRPGLAIKWSTGRIESGGFAIYPRPKSFPEI